MKLMSVSLVAIIICTFVACNWLPDSLQDSMLEEQIEDKIQDETGVKVDLTGESPEKVK